MSTTINAGNTWKAVLYGYNFRVSKRKTHIFYSGEWRKVEDSISGQCGIKIEGEYIYFDILRSTSKTIFS